MSLVFSEDWLDRADDSVPTADLDATADLERLLVVQTAVVTTSSPRRSS
jgi:hypothetical protein